MALNSTPSTSLTSLVVGGGLNSPAKLTEQAPPGSTIVQPGSVAFEVQSTTKAMLPPRMTTVQKNAIVNTIEGSLLYDSTIKGLSLYNGTIWETVESGGSLVKIITKVITGAAAIRAALGTPIPLFTALAQTAVLSANLTIGGLFFTAIPPDLFLTVQSTGAPPFKFVDLNNQDIFKNADASGARTTNLTQAGAANGGILVAGNSININFIGTSGGLTGGDATTTLTIQTVYINQNA